MATVRHASAAPRALSTADPSTPGGDEGRADVGSTSTTTFPEQVAAEAPGLYRYAVSLVGNPQIAQDLVSDTVVRALERQRQFRRESSLRTWLHRILHHLAVDQARHLAHEITVQDVDELWGDRRYSVDPASVVDLDESREELQDALLHLPFAYRSVVVLHDAERWTAPEIADSLGIGLAATKQRLRRGRAMLVSLLAQRADRQEANRGVVLSCRQARRRVSSYIDHDLEPQEQVLLEKHLKACATCPPLYAALVGVQQTLGRLHDPNSVIPPPLARRIEARMRQGTIATVTTDRKEGDGT